MRIIIVGCGKMGLLLAERLIAEKHDVTLIDRDEAVLEHAMDTLDALTIKGNGVSVATLQEADIKHTDIVIATTVSDETNMLCCLTSKLQGAKYTIARIRDPEYLTSLHFITKELFINYVVNPERATAREISRMLRLPFAASIETFARGRVEMVEIRATGREPFVEIPLKDLYKKHSSLPRVLFCAIERSGRAIIPKGDFIIHSGDKVFIASDTPTISAFFKAMGKDTRGVHDAMIVGGSRIAYYLAQLLQDSGVKTTIIENKPHKARWLSEELKDATIIQGDGTDQQLLLSEGLSDAQSFITLTDRDEENLMAGMYASRHTKGKVIVKSNRTSYSELLKDMGLESIISPTQIACNIVLRTVRARANADGTTVERMYSLIGGNAEALEFIPRAGASYLGIPLKNLKIHENVLVAVIVRSGHVLVPFGDDTIEADDHVVIITKEMGIVDLGDVIGRE
ncbi:MAG: Trk system potassium transporter TrkA [Clostridia bacterium]|nr:Trk system potassium transporter TrkA [Clostridia bacterium]